MEIIGFLALVALGLWLVISSVFGTYAVYGFSGKVVWPVIIFGIVGAGILYFAFTNSPVALVVR